MLESKEAELADIKLKAEQKTQQLNDLRNGQA
jgi:hypothetical protein